MCKSVAQYMASKWQIWNSNPFSRAPGWSGVCLIAQSCLTLCDPLDYSLPGSSVHGIFQARIVEWVSSSRGIFLTQGLNLSLLYLLYCRQILYLWATWEAQDLKNPGWIQWLLLLQSFCFICMKAISFPHCLATPKRWKFMSPSLPCPRGGKGLRTNLSVQFSSVAQSCLTPWDPMSHSMPGLPVHHQLPEFTQTHVHRVSDAIHD